MDTQAWLSHLLALQQTEFSKEREIEQGQCKISFLLCLSDIGKQRVCVQRLNAPLCFPSVLLRENLRLGWGVCLGDTT